MGTDDDKPERAFHLETWRIAPAAQQVEGATTIIDELERLIATFQGEAHRENAARVIRALRAPATRSREVQNYAIRQQLRVNKRLRRHLAVKGFEVDAACSRLLERDGLRVDLREVAIRGMRTDFHEQALVRLALVEAKRR